MLKKWLTDNFELNRGERKGILVLIFIIGILLLIQLVIQTYPQLIPFSPPSIDVSYSNTPPNRILDSVGLKKRNLKDTIINPNSANSIQLQSIGLTEKQAQTVINYRTKGGQFYSESDLARVYNISEEQVKAIASKLIFDQRPNKFEEYKSTKPYKSSNTHAYNQVEISLPFPLNTVDANQLLSTGKLSEKTAYGLVGYRRLLGGFHSKSQLREIRDIQTEELQFLTENVQLTPKSWNQFSLDTFQIDTQFYHPYFSPQVLGKIRLFLRFNDYPKKPEEWKKLKSIKPEKLDLLLPYLTSPQSE